MDETTTTITDLSRDLFKLEQDFLDEMMSIMKSGESFKWPDELDIDMEENIDHEKKQIENNFLIENEEYLNCISIGRKAFLIRRAIITLLPHVDNLKIFDDNVIKTLDRIKNDHHFISTVYYINFISHIKKNFKMPNKLLPNIYDEYNKSLFLSPSEGDIGKLFIEFPEQWESSYGFEPYL